MKGFILKIEKLSKSNLFYFLATLQGLLILGYVFTMKNLEKLAGFVKAVQFMFFNPGDYFGTILLDIVSWIFSIAQIILGFYYV